MKIYCLVGASGSGKSTIAKEITKRTHLKSIISSTSRPKRSGEIEGEDYFFISAKEFKNQLDNNEFLEFTCYNDWYYGINMIKNQMDFSSDQEFICVVNPIGLERLKGILGEENIISFYLDANPIIRKERCIKREDNPDIKEINRRLLNDEIDLKDIKNKVNCAIVNDNMNNTIEFILSKINKKYLDEYLHNLRISN